MMSQVLMASDGGGSIVGEMELILRGGIKFIGWFFFKVEWRMIELGKVSLRYFIFVRWSFQLKKIFPPRIELRTFCVLSRRDNHYTTGIKVGSLSTHYIN